MYMKFYYVVLYDNSSDQLDIGQGHGRRLKNFSIYPTIQTVRSYKKALVYGKEDEIKTCCM